MRICHKCVASEVVRYFQNPTLVGQHLARAVHVDPMMGWWWLTLGGSNRLPRPWSSCPEREIHGQREAFRWFVYVLTGMMSSISLLLKLSPTHPKCQLNCLSHFRSMIVWWLMAEGVVEACWTFPVANYRMLNIVAESSKRRRIFFRVIII